MTLSWMGRKSQGFSTFQQSGIMNMVVAKLTRYSQKWPHVDKGTIDSVHDMGVYSFMLESLDSAELEKKSEEIIPF